MDQVLMKNVEHYWTERASSYSDVNIEELNGCQRKKWQSFLADKIDKHFQGRPHDSIRILDIGAGPGFISIILAELGYRVTAADYTQAMLDQARANAGNFEKDIRFIRADAQNMPFEDAAFEVVFCRNLTWNLQDPQKAYSEWLRILAPDGLLLVFDANWYSYLFDDALRNEYDLDRINVAKCGVEDYNIGENFNIMEEIARKMPLSSIKRPMWDIEILQNLGAVSIKSEENVGVKLYSEVEQINYRSTPMFCVSAVKRK